MNVYLYNEWRNVYISVLNDFREEDNDPYFIGYLAEAAVRHLRQI